MVAVGYHKTTGILLLLILASELLVFQLGNPPVLHISILMGTLGGLTQCQFPDCRLKIANDFLVVT